jgi:hypothetical protein
VKRVSQEPVDQLERLEPLARPGLERLVPPARQGPPELQVKQGRERLVPLERQVPQEKLDQLDPVERTEF